MRRSSTPTVGTMSQTTRSYWNDLFSSISNVRLPRDLTLFSQAEGGEFDSRLPLQPQHLMGGAAISAASPLPYTVTICFLSRASRQGGA